MLKVISQEQFTRLRQIEFQCIGVAQVAVQHENTAALFGLSRDLQAKLLSVETKYARALGEASVKAAFNIGKLGGKPAVTDRPEIVVLRKERNQQALQLLTERQRQAWQILSGEPFQGSLTDAKGKRAHPKVISLP